MTPILDLLWRNAVVVVPLVLLVVVTTRFIPCKPSTRHMLWVMLLGWLVLPPLVPGISTTDTISDAVRIPVPAVRSAPDFRDERLAGRDSVETLRGSGRHPFLSPEPRALARAIAPDSMPLLNRLNRPAKTGIAPEPTTQRPGAGASGSDVARLDASSVGRVASERSRRLKPAAQGGRSSLIDSSPATATTTTARTMSRSPRRLVPVARSRGLLSFPRKLQDQPDCDLCPLQGAPLPAENPRLALGAYSPTPKASTTPAAGSPVVRESVQSSAAPESINTGNAVQRESAIVWLLTPWIVGLVAIRDAAVALPRIPTVVWLGGAVLFAWSLGVRVLVSLWRLRRASPAPREVRAMVRRVSRRFGLKSAPKTYMFVGRMGPMILCGRTTKLMLPSQLWSQLDHTAREAILCHELAHIKRRDHWVCRAELLVAALFWWHPLVWWIRHRLHEEAEICCDAWVTWLMPYDRRAYAEALLHTKSYINENQSAVPMLGIGVASGRASRFARRLTMVMTGSVRPRLSGSGIAVVAALAVVGWLANPAQSCPEDAGRAKAKCGSQRTNAVDKCADCKLCADCDQAGFTGKCGKCKPCKSCGKKKCSLCCDNHVKGKSTYEQHVAQKVLETARNRQFAAGLVSAGIGHDAAKGLSYAMLGQSRGGRGSDLDERMERLERRLEELMERLGEQRSRHRAPREPREAREPRRPRAPRTPPPPTPPTVRDRGDTSTRSYELPAGKLEALTQLMVRSDVPLVVRPGEDQIEVIATDAQHVMFKAFVDMINGSTKTEQHAYALPKGKLDALVALMVRDDVPVLVSPRDDSIGVQGTSVQHAVFKAFVDMIHPHGRHAGRFLPGSDGVDERRAESRQEHKVRKQRAVRRNIEHKRHEHEYKARTKARKQAGKLRTELDSQHLQELLERAAEVLGTEHAKRLLELSHSHDEHSVSVLRAEAEGLTARALELAAQVTSVEQRAEEIRTRAELLEEQSEELGARAGDLEDAAEDIRNQADDEEAMDKIDAILAEARGIKANAKKMEFDAQNLEGTAEVLEQEAGAMDDKADQLDEKSEAFAELAEFLLDTIRNLEERYAESQGS